MASSKKPVDKDPSSVGEYLDRTRALKALDVWVKTQSITEVRRQLGIKKRADAEFFVDEGKKLVNDELDVDRLRGELHAMDMDLLREMYLMAKGLEEIETIDPETGEVTVELKKTGQRSSNAAKTAGAAMDRILNRYGGSLEKKSEGSQQMIVITGFPWEMEPEQAQIIDGEAKELEPPDDPA